MRETRPRQARLSEKDWLPVESHFGSIRSVLKARGITPGRMAKMAGGLRVGTLYEFLKKGSELRLLYVAALVREFHTELTFEGVAREAQATMDAKTALQAEQAAAAAAIAEAAG